MKVYRQHLREVLQKTDNVVELGCHVGKSSELILYKLSTGNLISIDNSPEAIEHLWKGFQDTMIISDLSAEM